jgi:hypothetical protein
MMAFKADELVFAVEPFWIDTGGGDRFIEKGETVRGNDPAARRAPQFFAAAGSTTAEVLARRNAIVAASIAAEVESDQKLREEQRKREPEIPLERRLRVKQGFRMGFGGRNFAEGEIVDREDAAVKPIVAAHSGYFEIPGRPLP